MEPLVGGSFVGGATCGESLWEGPPVEGFFVGGATGRDSLFFWPLALKGETTALPLKVSLRHHHR